MQKRNTKLTKGGALDHYVASDRPDWLSYFLLTFFDGREAKSKGKSFVPQGYLSYFYLAVVAIQRSKLFRKTVSPDFGLFAENLIYTLMCLSKSEFFCYITLTCKRSH